MTPSENPPPGAEAAAELLARRVQLQEWLQRLDSVEDDIPAQVKRRVRADYEQRLQGVVAELSAHSDALSADRERLDERLIAAAERHDLATEALEEARLRHRIGELSAEEWEGRRPELEAELETARGEREDTEREISALEELLGQLHAGESHDAGTAPESAEAHAEAELESAPAADAPLAADEAGDFAGAADEWDPELPEIEPPADWPPVAAAAPGGEAGAEAEPAAADDEDEDELPIMGDPLDVSDLEVRSERDSDLVEITTFAAAAEALAEEVDPAPVDDDYAFLQELDRAIAATAPGSAGGGGEEPEPDTRPQPGLKCPDCGYSNDPAAWYCGVCGVDLG